MIALLLFQMALAAAIPGEVDRQCGAHCEILVVHDGTVQLIDEWPPGRNLVLGRYAPAAEHLVPGTEAPVGDLRSKIGWRVVASIYLDHQQNEILTHLRFFTPTGALVATESALSLVEQAEIGSLFGGTDEMVAITSSEEHAYNGHTEIWFLPPIGVPKLVIDFPGTYKKFVKQVAAAKAGVIILREKYDGERAETKGRVEEFWQWNTEKKSLAVSTKGSGRQ